VRREIGGRGLRSRSPRRAFLHACVDALRACIDAIAITFGISCMHAATRAIACMQRVDASTTMHSSAHAMGV
jgi:hypothetical protein